MNFTIDQWNHGYKTMVLCNGIKENLLLQIYYNNKKQNWQVYDRNIKKWAYW